jgi:hypothetical protein
MPVEGRRKKPGKKAQEKVGKRLKARISKIKNY